jgi:predicted MFS family arabinose efflux permease
MDRVGQVAYTIAAIAGGVILSYYGPKWPRAVLAVFIAATAIWSLSFARRWHERLSLDGAIALSTPPAIRARSTD